MTGTGELLRDYVEGFAELIAADTDPALTVRWRTSGDYNAGELGIWVATVPTNPDRIITLTPSTLGAHPTLSSGDVNLQTRYRAGPDVRDVWAIRAAVRSVLLGRFPMRLPTGVYVSALTYGYGGSLGQDGAKRWEWADNWRTSITDR